MWSGRGVENAEKNNILNLFSRPVVVTFQEFKDREEVLRKSGVLKGNNIHITEDMSRWKTFVFDVFKQIY